MRRKRITKNDETPKPEGATAEQHENRDDTPTPVQERPRICLLDVAEDVTDNLTKRDFNCYRGTLGPLVEVNNMYPRSARQCLLNFDFPPNLHEYDIAIVDLQRPTKVPYAEEEHLRTQTKEHRQPALVSSFPQTIFDPRALSASILESRLLPFMKKESILVIFAAAHESTEYHPIVITPGGTKRLNSETHSLYEFYSDLPSYQNLTGRDTRVVLKSGSELASLLERHNNTAVYEITFAHPTHWEDNERVKNKNFIPLIEARPDEIVSFACMRERNVTFLFPRIEQKEVFLTDLLEKVLPEILPEIFPFSTQFAWIADSEYQLPNESELLDQKANIEMEYEAKLREMDGRIDANRQEYGFLHDLLTQSGPELVKTVERYLGWLGFANVVNVDEINPDLREEDLRVEDDRGLLVIEVKGIGGTSTDSECSQISKIKYRRSKERGTFDVFALYMVNHQRFLPPAARTNPPFNAIQIADAENDERGLVTTYDLFKLYFNVVKGHITKDDARAALYRTGLVRFPPSGATNIAGPYGIHYGGYVVVFKAEDLEVRVGDSVVLDDFGRYRSAQVLEIQLDGTSVESAHTGEIGMKLSACVKKDTVMWLVQEHRE